MSEPDEELAILCQDLVKRYDDVVAVDGLDLEISRGECFGLLGLDQNRLGRWREEDRVGCHSNPFCLGRFWRGHGESATTDDQHRHHMQPEAAPGRESGL